MNPMLDAVHATRIDIHMPHWWEVAGPWTGEPSECFWVDPDTEYPCACIRATSGVWVCFVAGGSRKAQKHLKGTMPMMHVSDNGWLGKLAGSEHWTLTVLAKDHIRFWYSGAPPSIFAQHLYVSLEECKKNCHEVAVRWHDLSQKKKRASVAAKKAATG